MVLFPRLFPRFILFPRFGFKYSMVTVSTSGLMCRPAPAGDTFLFVGSFVGAFRENRPSTEGGWIPDIGIERVFYVASGLMAVQAG